MFETIQGLSPERAARLALLVERCEPLLGRGGGRGMEDVQRLLRDLGVGVMDAIVVTRVLTGSDAGPGGLAEAKVIVLASSARAAGPRTDRRSAEVARQAEDVADALRRKAQGRGATTIVAIDGAGGSGKTTLAAAVARHIVGSVVVHGDDFYRPMPDHERERLGPEQGYQRYFDWERLRDRVLVPLRDERAARYRTYDWDTGRLGPRREVAPGAVVIVEGVYSARPELAPYCHLTVYVDTPRGTCLERVRARGENSEEWIARWRAAEDHYLHTTWPQTRVDLLVRGC
ncbi:Uridine kinase [Streptomyces avidinii]